MSKLFIYYSHSGNGDIVSKEFEKAGFELRKVTEKKKMPKSFFWLIMAGGFRAGLGLKGKLVNYNNDVKDYDKTFAAQLVMQYNGKEAADAALLSLSQFIIYRKAA